jgi:transposase
MRWKSHVRFGRRAVETDRSRDRHRAAARPHTYCRETVLATHSFSTTRAGYRALIRWVRSFGDVVRVGVEGTGSYGAGLTRHLVEAGFDVLEVDRPDRSDRRRKGKDDDLDAISAARAALRGRRTSVPKGKDGAVESLRVLRVTRHTAVRARRNALQLLRMSIVSAPEELRDQVRNLTRMQLIRTCAAWRPDASNAADPVTATRIALKSLARRMLELGDEIAMLDDLIAPWSPSWRRNCSSGSVSASRSPARCWSPPGTTGPDCAARRDSRCSAASRRCRPPPA